MVAVLIAALDASACVTFSSIAPVASQGSVKLFDATTDVEPGHTRLRHVLSHLRLKVPVDAVSR